MTLSEKCKSLGITRDIISNDSGVPVRTLTTWYTTKPKLMNMLFSNYQVVECKPTAGDSTGFTPSNA